MMRERLRLIAIPLLAVASAAVVAFIYPNFSPYGLNGGHYYGRITVSF